MRHYRSRFSSVWIITLLSILLSTSSCNKDCIFALADLVGELIVGAADIPVGGILSITHVIKNIPEAIDACTEKANPNQTSVDVAYAPTSSSKFRSVYSECFPTPEIEAGEEVEDYYDMQFPQEGFYRLEFTADYHHEVVERDDGNNVAYIRVIDGSGKAAMSSMAENQTEIIIRVISNDSPEFASTSKSDTPLVRVTRKSIKD